MNIGILGGGLSGITLQRFLNHNSKVLEKENTAGGLCRTFHKEGFHYDIGGHILFSKDSEVMNFVKKVLGKNANRCRRNNKILFKGRYVKYPFENGLGALDKEDIYECLTGYLKNDHPVPNNFREWIYHTFGDGIADKYLIPFNKKIWKFPLEKMGTEWVDRVPKPPVDDIIRSAVGIETEGYLHQLYFYYPVLGGIEGLIKSLVKENGRVSTGFEIKKIQQKERKWIVSNGSKKEFFDKVVLTMPVMEAVNCMENVPHEVVNAARAMRYNSVRVVLLGINNQSLLDKSAVYVPDPETVFHRICFMGFFSKNMVPEGKSSLIAEVTTRKGHELYNVSDSGLIQKVIDDANRLGIIDKGDVITTDVKNIEYGYVIYDLDHGSNMKVIRDYFSSSGIELLGRFAEFEYINMDEVIRRSKKLAEKLNVMVAA